MRLRVVCLVALLNGLALTAASAACPSQHDVAIASAIATAAAAGGGRVDLPAGVLDICEPIVLRSNVHLRGAGRGATIIRTAPTLTGPLSSYGSIVGVAVANVSVGDLTLDQRTNNRVGNGIVFLPASLDLSGTVPYNILVENTQVIGAPVVGGHQYMIWNMRGQHVKILNNWIDGGFWTPPSDFTPQEGIESYGGYDVTVAGNTVEGIAGACLNFGSAGDPGTETVGLFIRDNYAFRCGVGLNIGTANPSDPQINAHSLITGNVIIYAWMTGITVWVAPGTAEHDLYIAGNTIRNVGVPGTPYVSNGIVLFGAADGTAVATTVRDNRIYGVKGIGFGISLWNYPNARVLDNTIVDVAREGIYAESSRDLEIRGNRIEAAGLRGIFAGSDNVEGQIVTGNVVINWGPSSDGIRLEGARYGVVQSNILRRSDAARPEPVVIGTTSCGVTVAGNIAAYSGTLDSRPTASCER